MPHSAVDSLAFWPPPWSMGEGRYSVQEVQVWGQVGSAGSWDPPSLLCHSLSLGVCLELRFEKKIHVIILINQMTNGRFAVTSSYMIFHIYSYSYPFLKVCRL